MESSDGSKDVVDPEVRAYVSSLVTALGGSGADEEGKYVLGDDALACLRDLKRWLKLYDEKANRLDVARCLAESNLVGGDLLQILAAWPENATDDKFKSRIALACLELLVPLTWPLERVGEMTVNHHRHTPYLQLAQLGYKRSIINFDGARILHTAVRVALPSMAVAMKDRSSRDEGMIKLVLYFIRNIAMIAPPSTVKYDGENEISRSATIDAFDYQDVLHLILALSSSMGEDFNTQDVVVMEILFHLVKGVDLEKLFMDEKQLDNRKVDELVSLRNQEAGMQRGYARTAPSRHGRFGTMIWIKRDDEKMSTVSGQDALINGARSLEKMDKSKKFKPPRRLHKGVTGPMDYITSVPLSPRASKNLRKFVEDFLDSGFNPLFQHLRKAMDREAERILDDHNRQFFFLISWFLEAERLRRKSKQADKSKSRNAIATEIDDSFGLVASVLNQEMFITMNRAMAKNYEEHAWDDLQATMKCFTQILLTVQEMSDSKIEDDQEIAENILSRIFYEDTTHDMVAGVVRTFKDQGFGYLDACTELAHVYIRILENYSKQNENLQVRSMRHRRKKKHQGDNEGDPEFSEGSDDQVDAARAERSSKERKFDFKRFATKFLTQGSIDTFVKLCGYYQDLKPDQLKRVHRFFYRIAFKMEMSIMLFRVDIIALLHKMIKGPEGLDPAGKAYNEWDELVRQILKKCTRKIQERPELIVEMLFSKTNSSAYFLEYGHYKQTVTGKPRPAAEIEVKGGMEWEKQIGVVVSAILDRNEGHHLEWIKGQLMAGETERRAWEAANVAMPSVENSEGETPAPADPPQSPSIVLKPSNDACKIAMFKNGYLRLLMTLVGFQRLTSEDDPETIWAIPPTQSSDQLKQSLDLIKKAEFEPPIFEDGKEAADFVRRKSALPSSRQKAAFDDESDNGIDDDDEELLFPAGGPTPMPKSDALAALKKRRRRRRRDDSEEPESRHLTDEQLSAREKARREKELEKQRKIKSDLFVHDSDDESDEERDRQFFDMEEKLRQKQKETAMKELLGVRKEGGGAGAEKSKADTSTKKRRAVDISSGSEDESESLGAARSLKKGARIVLEESEDEEQVTDTPLSSPHVRNSEAKRVRLGSEVADMDEDEDMDDGSGASKLTTANDAVDEDSDDEVPVARARPRKSYGGFIVDSSDEE